MAIAIGTNSGFVTATPTGDPGAAGVGVDNDANTTKDTSPSGTNVVTEAGFYIETVLAVQPDFTIGLYDATGSGGGPGALLFSSSGTLSLGAGWKTVTGLSWTLTASTAYWIGLWVADTVTATISQQATSGGAGFTLLSTQSSLPNPYGTPTSTDADGMRAFYALYQAVTGPVNLKSLDTNLKANIKSYNTNVIANVKSINTNV